MPSVGVISFFVPGDPATAGSRKPMLSPSGKAYHIDANKRARPWRAAVQMAAGTVHQGPPLEGALGLHVVIVRLRPKSHFGKRGLKATAPPYPISAPDCTKVLRALEDSCNKVLWRDDAQIIQQMASKMYGERPGAQVYVWRLDDVLPSLTLEPSPVPGASVPTSESMEPHA